jgi:multicomponent Na+:H+ antiporter subunit C
VEVELAFVVGGLYAAGLYLVMRRSIVKLIIELAGIFADPIPEALILTAIVIGFGVQAFAMVLIRRIYETTGTEDLNLLRSTDVTE